MKRNQDLQRSNDAEQARIIASVIDEEIITDAELEKAEGGKSIIENGLGKCTTTNNCDGGNCVAGCGGSTIVKPGTGREDGTSEVG